MSLGFDTIELLVRLLAIALVIISASMHEFGHAYAAHLCGDDTAKERGRMTINPLAHIDLFGSVILPLILVLSGSGYLAFAKPVPYNRNRLRNPGRDDVIVALAGPLMNILQAVAGALAFHACLTLLYGNDASPYYLYLIERHPASWIPLALQLYVQVNCSLAFFNLLPIPPLDGSKLLIPFFKGDARRIYDTIQGYALPVTMILIWIAPRYGIDPIGWWLDLTAGRLEALLLGWSL